MEIRPMLMIVAWRQSDISFLYQIYFIYKLGIIYQMNVIVYYHLSTIMYSWLNKMFYVLDHVGLYDDGWCDQNMSNFWCVENYKTIWRKRKLKSKDK